jgi:hypothetical protein
MASYDALDNRVRELNDDRYKEYQQDVVRRKALADRAAKIQKERVKGRRDFMAAIGTDLKKLDAAVDKENRSQEEELKAFLEEFRPKTAGRDPQSAATSKDAAVRSAVLAESGHMVLPVLASTIFTTDESLFTKLSGIKEWADGAGGINSGWVFPDDPSKIRIMSIGHNPEAWCGFWEYAHNPSVFAVHFAFVPASTATYEMTAVIAFHGFYILRSDDGVFTCKEAIVKLNAQMNVHQYADTGWQDFPLLNIDKQNTDEIASYDRTHFLDYTTGLRMGDPVVVTVKGTVEALGHGGGSYAELNFFDGTANYIQPLFLSVQQV